MFPGPWLVRTLCGRGHSTRGPLHKYTQSRPIKQRQKTALRPSSHIAAPQRLLSSGTALFRPSRQSGAPMSKPLEATRSAPISATIRDCLVQAWIASNDAQPTGPQVWTIDVGGHENV